MSQAVEGGESPRATRRSDDLSLEYTENRNRLAKAALIIGFLALSTAVLSAYSSPATGYELSIYADTPLTFWVGIGVALLVALCCSFAPGIRGRTWQAALLLGGGAGLAIGALPILRGYYFFGSADSLTHLGWTKEIITGVLDPFQFLYPGIHLIAASISQVSGVAPPLALQYTVLAFVPVFLLFVPLCVRVASGHEWGLPVGVFVAVLFLPISNISMYLEAYPTTQAVMFAPLVLYLLFQYLADRNPQMGNQQAVSDGGLEAEAGTRQARIRETSSRVGSALPTSIGALLMVGSTGLLFVHPQQAVNILLIYLVVAVVQFLFRRRDIDHPIAHHRLLYVQTVLFSLVFTLWIVGKERVSSNALITIQSAIGTLFGTTVTGDEIAGRSGSLLAVGGSIPELFLKVFGVSAVFAGLAGLFMLASISGLFEDSLPDRNAIGKYLTAGFIPLIGLFVVYIVSSHSVFYFRQAGFIMMIVTILGGVLITRGTTVLSDVLPTRTALVVVGLCFVIAMPLSIITVYNSPYMYQPSDQVSESRLSGYETGFDHRSTGIEYAGIRGGPSREADAIFGTQRSTAIFGEELEGPESSAPPSALQSGLPGYYNESHYLFITTEDFQRDVSLYDGFRYPRESFAAVRSTPDVHRVQSNQNVRLYFVAANNTTDGGVNASTNDTTAAGANATVSENTTNATSGANSSTGVYTNATTDPTVSTNNTNATATGVNASTTNTSATSVGNTTTNSTAGA
jgi:hypothetical protein